MITYFFVTLQIIPFLPLKKPSSLKNYFSGTRADASCYHPKFTYTSRYKPYQLRMRNDSSIVYHCNGCTRRSLGVIASVRSSETIFSSSFCACSHLIRLSVTYLTTYSSLHSLWYYLCKSYSGFIILSMFLRISTFPFLYIKITPILQFLADSCLSNMYTLFCRDVFCLYSTEG